MLWLLLVYSHLVQGGHMYGECICSFLDSFATELIAEGRARCWALSPCGLSLSHAVSVYRKKDRDNPCGVSLRDTHICVGVRDRDFCVYAEGRKLTIPVDYWLQIHICVCISQTIIREVWTFKQHRWECEMVLPFWKTFWQILKMSDLELAHDPAIPLLCINPNTCAHMFTAAQFLAGNHPRDRQQAIRELIHTMWSIHTVEYDSAMKRSEALTQLQCRCTLNTWCSAREADAKGRTVLVCLGCHSKTEGWGPQQQIFVSYKSGGQTSEMKVSGWWVLVKLCSWWGAGSSLCPHKDEGLRGLLGVSFVRVLIPFMRSLLSWPHRLLKAPPPHTITLGVRFQHVNFRGKPTSSPEKPQTIWFHLKETSRTGKPGDRRWVRGGEGQWEDLNKPCTLGCSGVSHFWLHVWTVS